MLKVILVMLCTLITANSYAETPKEALAAFYSALASGNKVKATELLAPNVTIYESGYVERSRAEYAGHHMQGDMDFAKSAVSTVLQHTERVEGNLATIWQETETKATIKGKPVTILGTQTALLEKNGDGWRIVHVHWSSRKPK